VSFVIRLATPDDAAGVAGVLNPIIEDGGFSALDTTFTVGEERAFIERFPARGIFHVAVDDAGAVAGFQVFEPLAPHLHALDHVGTIGTYVDLTRRRQGIASHLFAATFAAAVAKGYEKIFTFVRADNPIALNTYLYHGFTVVGTAKRHAKIRGVYVDEVMIEKQL
jgi:L-amino acid N-acyltransferase YncA